MNTKEATKPTVDKMTIAEIEMHERRLHVLAIIVAQLTRLLYMTMRGECLRLPVTIAMSHCTIEITEGVEPFQPHVSLIFKKPSVEEPVTDGDGVIPFSGSDEG